jgi:hypothetical protein
MHPLRRWIPDAGLGLFVVAVVAARSIHREYAIDIHLWDEALYLRNGVDLLVRGPPGADWGPLYAVWYWVESLAFADRVSLYYANWAFLLAAILGAFAFFLRSLGVGPALVAIVLVPVSMLASLDAPPHSSMLADALVLGACGLAARARLGGAVVTLVLASFVRPEFMAAALPAAIMAAVASRSSLRALAVNVLVPVVATVGLGLVLGSPLGSKTGALMDQDGSVVGAFDRSFGTFGWHYAEHRERASPSGLDFEREWPALARRDFPGATSVLGAFRINPSAFLWHVRMNLSSFWQGVLDAIGFGGSLVAASLLILAVFGTAILVRHRRFQPLMIAACVMGVQLLAVVIVSPRPRFFDASLLLAFALATVALSRGTSNHTAVVRPPEGERYRRLLVAGAFVLLFGIPSRTSFGPWWLDAATSTKGDELPNVSFARILQRMRQADPEKRFLIVESNAATGTIAGWNSRSIEVGACPLLERCIHATSVVIVDQPLRALHAGVGDTLFAQLLASPESIGFVVAVDAPPDRTVLVRPGLFANR